MQCSAVQCSTVQCSAIQCSAVQCSAVQCSAVQCYTVQSTKVGRAVQFPTLQWNTVHCTDLQCSDRPLSAVSSLQHSAGNYTGAVQCRELYRRAPLHSHYTLDFTRWLLNEPVIQNRIWLTTKMSNYKCVSGIAILIRSKEIRLCWNIFQVSHISHDSNPELSCLFLIFGLGSSSWQLDRPERYSAILGNIWQYIILSNGILNLTLQHYLQARGIFHSTLPREYTD